MQQPPFEISAARALVDQLQINGVERAYCCRAKAICPCSTPATSAVSLTVCRNEAGAAMMADAYGKAPASPGFAS